VSFLILCQILSREKGYALTFIQNITQNISQHEKNQYGLTKFNTSLRYQVLSKSGKSLGKMFGGNESNVWFSRFSQNTSENESQWQN
jgi:hypothetical protein